MQSRLIVALCVVGCAIAVQAKPHVGIERDIEGPFEVMSTSELMQCLQTMNLLALEAPMAHADAVEKSKVIVDENQKLVDNITIALTEYVVRKGDELPVVDDAIDILEEVMEIITGDDDSDSDSDSDDDNDNDNVNDMYCTQNHISGNFILNNGGVNTLPLLRTATPRLEYASFFTS
uniref:Secreted protein n=1 Tax=Panagrellus redivivus TaxID=6233 RepID=A0A7E4V9Y5_PANRE